MNPINRVVPRATKPLAKHVLYFNTAIARSRPVAIDPLVESPQFLPSHRCNFIDRDSHRPTQANPVNDAHFFQRALQLHTDVSMRPTSPLWSRDMTLLKKPHAPQNRPKGQRRQLPNTGAGAISGAAASSDKVHAAVGTPPVSLGERLMDVSCRWSAKFYGQVTFGPRGFAYPSSRWLARRFRMKKHKILKRFRFRRYKLAAVANLPFAKMIRVGMLPELKSSKTRKGDAVDSGLSSQLVTQARTTTGGKVKGRRSRPKSKYQV